ncbi:TPA: hypothetical protein DIU46_01945 [Patescibacteria group bacterium]|nr:hypothetical protein [Patescibacteria group bacterium]HCR42705.1 hypothetical protein [Patescibacteria group bacterium]
MLRVEWCATQMIGKKKLGEMIHARVGRVRNLKNVMENEEVQIRLMSLCFLRDAQGRVLLGRKSDKPEIGAGTWNGFGGKRIEADESLQDTARREVWEETGERVRVGKLISLGQVDFRQPTKHRINRVHLFSSSDFTGEPEVNEEMVEFGWFNKEELPLDQMMEADGHFIPELMKGKQIRAEFTYTEDFKLEGYWSVDEIGRIKTETEELRQEVRVGMR